MKYKFYSPLLGVIDYTGDDRLEYDTYYEEGVLDFKDDEDFDYLTQEDLVGYADVINERLRKEWDSFREARGLMEYFISDESCTHCKTNSKVYSAWPQIEVVNGKAYAVMVCEINDALEKNEAEVLKKYFEGQYSDGLGESLAQHCIKMDGSALYLSLWPEDFYIRTEEEFSSDLQQERSEIGMSL